MQAWSKYSEPPGWGGLPLEVVDLGVGEVRGVAPLVGGEGAAVRGCSGQTRRGGSSYRGSAGGPRQPRHQPRGGGGQGGGGGRRGLVPDTAGHLQHGLLVGGDLQHLLRKSKHYFRLYMENIARSQWLPATWLVSCTAWGTSSSCLPSRRPRPGRGTRSGRGWVSRGAEVAEAAAASSWSTSGCWRTAAGTSHTPPGLKETCLGILKSRTLPTLWLFRSLCWNMLMSVSVFINGWSNPRPAAAILQLQPQPGNSVTTSQHHLTLRRHHRPRETPGAGRGKSPDSAGMHLH